MWYTGCRAHLRELHPAAFEGGDTSYKNYYDGMYGMMRGIAEKNTYGDFDKVADMYVHYAMKEITATKEDEDELKRRYPNLYK